MSDLNPLERQLRSWKPRPPAAHLKERIFPGQAPARSGVARPPATEEPAVSASRMTWPWLAPAMALFLFVTFVSGPGSEGTISRQWVFSSNRFSGESVREPALVAYLADAAHSPHNNCQTATLEWTNDDHSLTTSAPIPGTNSLFQ